MAMLLAWQQNDIAANLEASVGDSVSVFVSEKPLHTFDETLFNWKQGIFNKTLGQQTIIFLLRGQDNF